MRKGRFLLIILASLMLPLAACSVQAFQVNDAAIAGDPLETYEPGFALHVDGYFFFTDFSSVYRMKAGSGKAEKIITMQGGVDEILYQSGYIYLRTHEQSLSVNYRIRTDGSGKEKITPGGTQRSFALPLFATGGKMYYWCDTYILSDSVSEESNIEENIRVGNRDDSFGWKGKAYYAKSDGLYQITDDGKSKKILNGYIRYPMGREGVVFYEDGKGVEFYEYGPRTYEFDIDTGTSTPRPELSAGVTNRLVEYVGTRNGKRYYYYHTREKNGLYTVENGTVNGFIHLPGALYYTFNEESGRLYFMQGENGDSQFHLMCYDVESGQTVDATGRDIDIWQNQRFVYFTQDFIYYIDNNEIHAIDTRTGNDMLLYHGDKI